MGKMIAEQGSEKGHEVISDPKNADVFIDFSHPEAISKHLDLAISHKKNMVMGTTGWYEKIPEIRNQVEKSGIGFVYSPNFSIGIQSFLKMAEACANIIAPFEEYDASGLEYHHKHKVDSPSGTALALQKAAEKNGQKKCPFTAVRSGHFPGTHTIVFDSPFDTITITHTARNRLGFVFGALKAADWIYDKKGFYLYEA